MSGEHGHGHAHGHGQVDDGLFKVAINLGLAGLMAGVVLAALNFVTEPIRLENEAKAREEGKRAVLPGALTFTEIEHKVAPPKAEPGKEAAAEPAHAEPPSVWYKAADASGKPMGYVMEVKQKGFAGEIHLLVGVDPEMKIVDYRVLKHNETPGLGAKMKEDEIRGRFKGRTVAQLDVSKKPDPARIQAITGATITTRAVANGIKRELTALSAAVGGGSRRTKLTLRGAP